MGNNTSITKPTKKLEILSEEVKDFSANISTNVMAEASQNIVVNQEQNIVINNAKFTNCEVSARQEATVVATQIASFKVLLSNPKQVLKKIADGPNSIFGQAMNSNSEIMKDFLETAKEAYNIPSGGDSDVKLRQKLTSIVKINLNQNVIMKATQNVFVNQKQNVFLNNIECNGSKLNFTQSVVVEALQNVIFTVAQNALSNDPTFRRAVRKFNGDYNKNLYDEQIEEGSTLPDVCFDQKKNPLQQPSCPDCDDCPLCPPPQQCNLDCPKCDDYILTAKTLYYVLIAGLLLMFITLVFS
jgi:hypothetical protein